jgi:2-polyprenyl-3-methyl-5-hydroxy-6-metoxy-1,4-benzoquinol methylase
MKSKNLNFKCRLCNSINTNTIIILKGFPRAAQNFISNLNMINKDEPVTLSVCQCQDCSLIQLRNNPVSYYKNVITAAGLTSAAKKDLKQEWLPIINKYKLTGKKAIEIGSGRGEFLEIMKSLEIDIIGLENSKRNIDLIEKKKLNVIKNNLIKFTKENNKKYSLVVCNNFLEHQPNIKKYIASLTSLLNKDGILYISVPNAEYFINKSVFVYELITDHLVYFTEKTLIKALELNGLEVISSNKKNKDNDLVVIAKIAKKVNIDNSITNVDQIIKSLIKKVNKYDDVVIWGAGHRSITLMAMAKLDKIKYVVDSARFKQNKFTPIIHKKIISPLDFCKTKCDLLIIMLPGNWSNQVVSFLKEHKITCKYLVFEDNILIN